MTARLTTEALAELERLAAECPPGPWFAIDAWNFAPARGCHEWDDWTVEADGRITSLAVATFNALPALLDVAEAARRYRITEWAIRMLEDLPRLDPRWNFAVDERKAADDTLRAALARLDAP